MREDEAVSPDLAREAATYLMQFLERTHPADLLGALRIIARRQATSSSGRSPLQERQLPATLMAGRLTHASGAISGLRVSNRSLHAASCQQQAQTESTLYSARQRAHCTGAITIGPPRSPRTMRTVPSAGTERSWTLIAPQRKS